MANRIFAVIYQSNLRAEVSACAKHAPMKISSMSGSD